MLRSLLVVAVAGALVAQAPAPVPTSTPTPPPRILVSAPFDGVFVDDEPARDGRFWARGPQYKMSFGADGAAFLPLFRSDAPRHWPVAFRLPGRGDVTPVMHETGAILAAPGFPIEEHWELRPAGAEQTFLLRTPPQGNVLELQLQSDLPYGGHDAQGHHFVVEGFGEVVYGDAFAVGAGGEKALLQSTFAAGTLRIELPANASYPLVVDPFVATIGVASNESFDNRDPDVAFDASTNRWCVVMTERVSALDTDLKVRRFDQNGVLLDTDYFESSSAVVAQPSIAASTNVTTSSGGFLVAWQEAGNDIIARRLLATASAPQAVLTVYDGVLIGGNFGQRPDVAGSPDGSFLIVFVEEFATGFPGLTYRGVLQSGSLTASHNFGLFTGCITPKVADMRGSLQHWPIAWADQASGCLAGDVKFAAVNLNLGVEAPPTVIAGAVLDDDRHVDLAWDGTQGLIVWDRDMGLHHDVFGQAFTRTAAGYQTVGAIRNLSALEPGITLSGDQVEPVVATDGVRYAVSYLEGNDHNPFCATFAIVNNTIVCHEGHVAIATAAIEHDDHAIAAMGTTGGSTTRYFVVTDERDGLNDYDVQGLFYDGRHSGAMFTTVGTGCIPIGGSEPQIAVSGGSDLGNTFTLQLSGTVGLPFVIAGIPQTPAPVLCSYLVIRRCSQGVLSPFLATTFGPSLSVTVPRSVGFVGMDLAFQGLDLLSTGACPASLFGAAFAVTDTVVASIR